MMVDDRPAGVPAGTATGCLPGRGRAAETAFAQQVVVQGNRRVDSETIRSYRRLRAGSPRRRAAIFATGMFER